MKAKNRLLLFFVLAVGFLLNAHYAQAICPVCTVAVAGGLGISRWLGIDDFISAIWIGGLALSVTAWGWNYLKKRNKLTPLTGIVVLVAVYLSILVPLSKFGYIGAPLNKLFGIDKIILGTAVGTVVFWAGAFTHSLFKKRNGGKSYFPMQKVAFPVGFLLVASLAYYLYCKCYNIF